MNAKFVAAIVVALSSMGAVAAQSQNGMGQQQGQPESPSQTQLASSAPTRAQVQQQAWVAARANQQEQIAESYTYYPVLQH